jgi:hypothetical protein
MGESGLCHHLWPRGRLINPDLFRSGELPVRARLCYERQVLVPQKGLPCSKVVYEYLLRVRADTLTDSDHSDFNPSATNKLCDIANGRLKTAITLLDPYDSPSRMVVANTTIPALYILLQRKFQEAAPETRTLLARACCWQCDRGYQRIP